MQSELPRTAAQGFLSGLAHPVIGLDHAAFIVAAGFLLALCRHGLWGVGALVAGSLAGAALHLGGIDLPGGEAAVALAVIAVGVLVAIRRTLPLGALAAGLALAGALHGGPFSAPSRCRSAPTSPAFRRSRSRSRPAPCLCTDICATAGRGRPPR